jgi:glycosyltransferase involved in cell wall biosynthesis
MTSASCFVSVVVPLHDDADILEGFVTDLVRVVREGWVNHEIVLVDDGSRDRTREVVSGLLRTHENLRYLRLSRRNGPEIAILAGADGVIGDVVVVLEPESDPPELLPRFVASAREHGGIAFGVRNRDLSQGAMYLAFRRRFVRLLARLLEIDVPDRASLYMAFTRQALNAILQIKDKSRALRIFGVVVGFPRHAIEYDPKPRRSEVRPKSVLEGIDRGVSMIVNNSTRPLRYAALIGLAASGLNLLYLCYVALVFVFKDRPAEGWVTTSFAITGMFFVVFAILTVFAEYLGRLLEESRDRPLYFVAEERNSSVVVEDSDRINVVNEST